MERELGPRATTFQDASQDVTTFRRAAMVLESEPHIPESAVLTSLDEVDPLDIDRRWPVYEAAATAAPRRRITGSLPLLRKR